jgi:hypothetical protein
MECANAGASYSWMGERSRRVQYQRVKRQTISLSLSLRLRYRTYLQLRAWQLKKRSYLLYDEWHRFLQVVVVIDFQKSRVLVVRDVSLADHDRY